MTDPTQDGFDRILDQLQHASSSWILIGDGRGRFSVIPRTATDEVVWERKSIEHHNRLRQRYISERSAPSKPAEMALEFWAVERRTIPRRRSSDTAPPSLTLRRS